MSRHSPRIEAWPWLRRLSPSISKKKRDEEGRDKLERPVAPRARGNRMYIRCNMPCQCTPLTHTHTQLTVCLTAIFQIISPLFPLHAEAGEHRERLHCWLAKKKEEEMFRRSSLRPGLHFSIIFLRYRWPRRVRMRNVSVVLLSRCQKQRVPVQMARKRN